jgi:hypothetical protein
MRTKLNELVNCLVYKKGQAVYQMFKICDHVLLTQHLIYIRVLMFEVLSKVLRLITDKWGGGGGLIFNEMI